MPDTGLTLTRQPPLSTAATTTADAPASVVWNRLAEDGLAGCIESATIGLVGDVPAGRRALALEERGVTALDGLFASALGALADGDPIREQRREQAQRAIREFGSAEGSALGLHAPIEELAGGPLAVLDAAESVPTVAVHIDGGGFGELRADQQRDVVGLLGDLAATCDLHVVAGRATQAMVRQRYHERLPVSQPCNASPSDGEVATRVETARSTLDGDSRETQIVRSLADEASETASYHALYADAQASESRVRQCISRLVDLDLVATFDGAAGRMVELLAAGREYLDALELEIGVQQSIPECVSDPPKSSDEDVCSPEPPSREDAPPDGGSGGSGSGAVRGGWTDARYLSRHDHAAVAGAVDGADIALSDHPVEGAGRSPVFSYDDDRDELVVGAEFHGSLQWLVCTARALAGPKMWNQVLTADRLDALPSRAVWTKCSQGGWCSPDERTNAAYIARLRDARDEILDATTDYRRLKDNGEDEDADELARWIIRQSQGLIGTMTRMLDYCGVDLIRYIQLPEYASDWHTSEDHRRRRSISKTIAKASSIGGGYGAYTAERTMYESRPEKRRFTLGAPDVTNDESGRFLGSWVIVGRGVSKMLDPADGPDLETALREPGELQEGGENFATFDVPLTIHTDRTDEAVRATIRRMCGHKNIRPTATARRIFCACTGSVFDITRALNHLAPEPADMPRAIRLDEVRRALATVPADRLLAETSSRSAGNLLKTMLNTTELTQTELANRADVSTQTVRNNADILEALELIERIDTDPDEPVEWRCSLPTREERGTAGLNPLRRLGDDRDSGGFAAMVRNLTEAIADRTVRDAFGTEIRDLNTLIDRCPALISWLRIAVSICGQELPPDEYGTVLFGEERTTGYGEPPAQSSLVESGPMAVAD